MKPDMTDMKRVVAQTYLGNIHEDKDLSAQVTQLRKDGRCWEVEIERRDRAKGRILTHAASGQSIGIIKDRTWQLREGDLFQTADGQQVLICLAAQTLMVLRFSPSANNKAAALVQIGYVLGNQHWPTTVSGDTVYVEQVAAQTTMEKIVKDIARTLGIDGLQISFESDAANDAIEFRNEHEHNHH